MVEGIMGFVVEEYKPIWTVWFEALNGEIWPAVKDLALSIEHVGSTSVPELAAKPVIDIDIVISSKAVLPAVVEALKKIGYEHQGDLGIEGREAFRSPVHAIKHHLYVCLRDSAALRNHLTLRDHLRKSPVAREEYSVIKRRLASEAKTMDEYVEGKTGFIVSILAKYGMPENELEAIVQANRPLR